MKLEEAAKQLKALSSPARLQICQILVRAGDTGLSIGQLRKRLDIEPSSLSNHLHKLISTGLVKQERWPIVCRANYCALDSLLGYLIDECCVDVTATILPGDHNSFRSRTARRAVGTV